VVIAALASGSGPGIGRAAARRLARAELSRAIYHPGESITARIFGAIGRFFDAASVAVPGGWWAVVVLAALLVLAAAATVAWIGPVGRNRGRASSALLTGTMATARDHRLNSERRAEAGDFAAAIIECVRAIAVQLEESAILPTRPGRTADELAAEAGRAVPAEAAGLREAARMFDDVRYGERPGTLAGWQRLRELDARLRSATVARATAGAAAGPGAWRAW
jgi:Domain of unknown function (DUF4129)